MKGIMRQAKTYGSAQDLCGFRPAPPPSRPRHTALATP